MLFSATTSYVLLRTNRNYMPILIGCGSVYLIALLIIYLLAPRLEPASVEDAAVRDYQMGKVQQSVRK
jgi:ACS family hexuronate transporter-like MFS transporter